MDVAVPFYSWAKIVQIHLKETSIGAVLSQELPYHKIHASQTESQEQWMERAEKKCSKKTSTEEKKSTEKLKSKLKCRITNSIHI